MATQLTLVNNVLRRLREDTVADITTTEYATLIAQWINDGIQSTQETYDWSSLIHELNVAVVADQTEYDLSLTVAGGGDVPNVERATTQESLLRFGRDGTPSAYIFQSSSVSSPDARLILITEDERYSKQQGKRDQSNLWPSHFSLLSATTGDGYLMRVWPNPSTTRHIRLRFWTPQSDLAIDDTDKATEIVVPNRPIEAYAHMIASNERGEEMGEPGNVLEKRWLSTLSGAVEAEMRNDGYLNRYESYRD